MDHIIDTNVSTTTAGITTTPGRPLTIPMKKEIKQTTSSINVTQTLSRRDNADTSVDAIQQYVRDTLLESSTEKVDLELKPFYNVPPKTYGSPTSYEASLFYEPPNEDTDSELYVFNEGPSIQGNISNDTTVMSSNWLFFTNL